MPVTPVFSLSQDDEFVYVRIKVPFVRVSDVEYVVDECDLSFFVKPYLLKLHFPANLVDDEQRTKAVYDATADNGTITLHLLKASKGEHFPDLDFLTRLQQPRQGGSAAAGAAASRLGASKAGSSSLPHAPLDLAKEEALLEAMMNGATLDETASDVLPSPISTMPPVAPATRGSAETSSRPLIQVVDSVEFESNEGSQPSSGEGQAQQMDTSSSASTALSQTASMPSLSGGAAEQVGRPAVERLEPTGQPSSAVSSLLGSSSGAGEASVAIGAPSYGFNHGHSGFFGPILAEFPELVDLPDPDTTPVADRRQLRIDAEDESFSPQRFLGDFFWGAEDPLYTSAMSFKGFWQGQQPSAGEQFFTDDEQEQMRRLTNREFLAFSSTELAEALCLLLDLTVAFAYDQRLTQAEPTVESAWTIRTICSSLSWLERFHSAEDVIAASVHRMLAYPYMRHLGLVAQVLEDASAIWQGGKRSVVRAVLGIHRIFSKSEQFYLLNRLYLTDVCVWIQQLDEGCIAGFAHKIAAAQIAACEDLFDVVRWDLARFIEEARDEGEEDEASNSAESSSDGNSAAE